MSQAVFNVWRRMTSGQRDSHASAFPVLPAREEDLYKLPPPALLLDRQVGGADHGGHPADGGGDAEGAGGGLCCL